MEKKSFYFEDYTESEIINQNKDSNILKISLNRVSFLFFIFFCLIFVFGIKIIYLSLTPENIFYSNDTKKNFEKKRRDIVDRNGLVLATNVNLYDVGLRPKLLNKKEKKNLLIQLSLLFPELNLNEIKNT